MKIQTNSYKIINEGGFIEDISYNINFVNDFSNKYNLEKIREQDSKNVLKASRIKFLLYSFVISILILMAIIIFKYLNN